MFSIFTAAHSEQRAVLYEGSEELSVKTAKLMLSRLGTGYYNNTEEERATNVLIKLGYIKTAQCDVDSDLIKKANETIRKANVRIQGLKKELQSFQKEIELLNCENEQLRNKLLNEHCSLTDKDILGYQELPESVELKKRYRSLASIHHPDKGGSNAMMQRLNESYENLKNTVV